MSGPGGLYTPPPLSQPIDIAVLVSGSGTNLQALLDHQGSYRVATVVSDRPDAPALERARAAGAEAVVVTWTGDRDDFTHRVCDVLKRAGVAWVVLAGFMRILGREAMERFPDRIVNIHPSLLPAFPGANAVAKALEYGVKQTGVTVHFVDEEVDHGPIIAQVPVEVLPDDDVGTLHARIQQQEHVLYPAVVDALVRGEIRVSGRKVEWRKQ